MSDYRPGDLDKGPNDEVILVEGQLQVIRPAVEGVIVDKERPLEELNVQQLIDQLMAIEDKGMMVETESCDSCQGAVGDAVIVKNGEPEYWYVLIRWTDN